MITEKKEMLSYKNFCKKVKVYFTNFYKNSEVYIKRTQKGDMLIIKQQKYNDITPQIVISSLYQRYVFGMTYKTILEDIERTYEMLINMKFKNNIY